MSSSINKVQLIGHLGRDPESKGSSGSGKIIHLNLATVESWKDKTTGERKDRTEWHRVVIFNENLATIAEKYLKKGSKVYLEGQLQTRKWNDSEGKEHYATEVVLSRFKGDMVILDHKASSDTSSNTSKSSETSSSYVSKDVFEDDIPF